MNLSPDIAICTSSQISLPQNSAFTLT